MTYIYVLVSKTFGSVVGAYANPAIAKRIAAANHCTISKVRIDGLYPGYLDSVKAIFGEQVHDEVEFGTYADPEVVTDKV